MISVSLGNDVKFVRVHVRDGGDRERKNFFLFQADDPFLDGNSPVAMSVSCDIVLLSYIKIWRLFYSFILIKAS